jgi:hypothetical protein
VEALNFIGQGFEVGQYQLHAAVFDLVSETVVSRFVRRAETRGLIATERLHGIGMNRLRLTPRGRDQLVGESDVEPELLFTPRRFVPLKDLLHTLWINDLRTALLTIGNPPSELLPAWALARRLQPVSGSIPDLLATWSGDEGKLILACEIDLGSERLNGVFLPKLGRLAEALNQRNAGGRGGIVVLTRGRRRVTLIREFAARENPDSPIMAFELPLENGPAGLIELRSMFDVGSNLIDKPAKAAFG